MNKKLGVFQSFTLVSLFGLTKYYLLDQFPNTQEQTKKKNLILIKNISLGPMVIYRFLLILAVAFTLSAGIASGTVEETAREVVSGLAHTGFENWSSEFITTNDRLRRAVLRSTLFVPNSAANMYGGQGGDREKLAAYHVVPERLEFMDLVSKANGSRLLTLLGGFSILVTNNSTSGFTLDGVNVTEPDIYVDTFMAIHGIAYPLDFTTYGSDSMPKTELQLFTFMLVTVVLHIISDIFFSRT